MKRPYELIPDAEVVLALKPEELGAALLEHLNSLPEGKGEFLHGYNFSLPDNFKDYPGDKREAVREAWAEGWAWLERDGLLVPKPGHQPGWVRVSSKGKAFTSSSDLDGYQKAAMLPRTLLHPRIADSVFSQYIRGAYDAAVFAAFKEVEVAVREAGGYASTDIGVRLIGKAFDVESGPLTDEDAPGGERKAVRNLFSGALGLFKNPSSHRHVSFTPEHCIELCLFATYLLFEVDVRLEGGTNP